MYLTHEERDKTHACGDWPNYDDYGGQVGHPSGGREAYVLRWGNRRYGLRHINRKRKYTNVFDKRIRWTLVCQPDNLVRRENLYDVVYEGWVRSGKVCKFRVIYSEQPLTPDQMYVEKGIVTAYAVRGTGC